MKLRRRIQKSSTFSASARLRDLTDGKGRKVNFKITIIVLTSNIGGEFIDKLAHIGFGTADATEATRYEELRPKLWTPQRPFPSRVLKPSG